MKPRLFGWMVALALFASANSFGWTARELLASPVQKERDLGAAVLVRSYVSPPRANWDYLVKRLKPGMKRTAVESELNSAKATPGQSDKTDNWDSREYRLDDVWVMKCMYTNSVLSGTQLQEQLIYIWVPPPANFSGDWLTYWVNGHWGNLRHYQDGRLDGLDTDYFSDGSKSIVYSYRNGVKDGEETAYFQSGKIKWKGQYKAGAQVGRWTWYKEDGKVESEKDFDKTATKR